MTVAERDEWKAGTIIPPVVFPLTYSRVVGLVDGTRDHFPGHHDPEYAGRQQKRTIYLNTMFLQGLLDRVATYAAGPGWWVTGRTLQIRDSVYAGDLVTVAGAVAEVRSEPDRLTMRFDVITNDVTRVTGSVTLARGSGNSPATAEA